MRGRRKVTKLTRQRAFATIKVVARAALAGEPAISYRDLASRLGMQNESGQGLGPILDEASRMCREHDLPDVACLVVTKDSIERGAPMPSDASFTDGKWAASDLRREDIAEEQERVRKFDWRRVGSLGLD